MVDEVISVLGVQIACLLPNMTGALQVLDLVVNGPLKAHTKNLRGARIVESFQAFKKKYEDESAKDVHERTLPVFQPPKPPRHSRSIRSLSWWIQRDEIC